MSDDFMGRVDARDVRVGIIGLGYVGLPLVVEFVRQGFHVTGFDIDVSKTQKLAAGESYLVHMPSNVIAEINATGLFEATTDFALIHMVDVIIICVPTPLTVHREPDMQYIVSTGEHIYQHLKPGQMVILESTSYPGTTDEVLRPILERNGLSCESDIDLVFSPEREDPGNPSFNTRTIPKVVGGVTQRATDRAVHLFSQVIEKVVPVSSTATAEAVKLTENIFRAVNIALVNELKVIYTKMGIDIWEVVDAAKTKPFGYMPFYPGPGLGGHCIPIDPFYLTWKAREFDCVTRFIETAGEINTAMPAYVIDRLAAALNDRGKAMKGARVLVLGVAYKKDIGDHRESPSLKLIELLAARGADVVYHDPFIPRIGRTRDHPHLADMTSVPLDDAVVAACEAVIIATDHSTVDYDALVTTARLVVDTRNATKQVTHDRDRIVRA